jgi:glycosyltransferase involved in cell wall biosynthesis
VVEPSIASAGAATPAGRPRVLNVALEAGSGYGGAEKVAFELATRLDSARFASYLCTIRASSGSLSDARDARLLADRGVQVLSLGQPGDMLLTPRGWARLYAAMARESIDIVHAHMPRASVPASLLARAARVPVVVSHEHGSALHGKRLRPFLDRHVVARMSTVMVAVSEWDRRNLIANEGIPAPVIRVIANGVPSATMKASAPSPGDARPEIPLIGAVGRLYPEKGHRFLVQAVALLRDRGRPVRCVILGDGPEKAPLQALIDELGLAGSVELLGWREDVGRIVGELDVAVLPSVREGSPLAALEYMAAAAPIVASRVGGMPELIEEGVHGLLVAPGDPGALASAIWRLLDDPTLALRLGRAASARRGAEFGVERLVERVEALYEELLAGDRER